MKRLTFAAAAFLLPLSPIRGPVPAVFATAFHSQVLRVRARRPIGVRVDVAVAASRGRSRGPFLDHARPQSFRAVSDS